MTEEEIQHRIEEIRIYSNDPEKSHGLEDKLREDFLRAVVNWDLGRVSDMAEMVLKSTEFDFARWYA